MRRRWLILIVAVVVIGVGVWVLSMRPDADVAVLRPQKATIRAWIEEQATTQLPHDVLIATPISGWLEPIGLREGDAVTEGQTVARLETDDLADRVRQAEQRIAILETKLNRVTDHRLEENALVEAEATVKAIDETVKAAEAKLQAAGAVRDFAAEELKRYRELVEESAAADREVRSANMEYRKAQAEYQSDALELAALKTIAAVSYIGPKFIRDYIDRKKFEAREIESQLVEARAALEIERRNLERASIASPIDGVVLHRHNTRRQYLQAGTPLLTVGNLDNLEVIAEILSERATSIQAGDPVEVFGEAIPGDHIKGRVYLVYPAGFEKISSLGVEQQRVKVAVTLDERPERLGVGFRVYVRIIHDLAENVLTLPRTALLRDREGGWLVLQVVDGETRFQPVTVGLMNSERVEIAKGLDAESRVVAEPTSDLDEGMRVDVREQSD